MHCDKTSLVIVSNCYVGIKGSLGRSCGVHECSFLCGQLVDVGGRIKALLAPPTGQSSNMNNGISFSLAYPSIAFYMSKAIKWKGTLYSHKLTGACIAICRDPCTCATDDNNVLWTALCSPHYFSISERWWKMQMISRVGDKKVVRESKCDRQR